MNTTRLCGILPLLFLAAALPGCGDRNPKAVDMPPPTVLASVPVERKVVDHQVFTARTQAVQTVEIKARVTGYLTKINFVDGAEVKKGDVLFEIDDRPYKATLDAANAAVEFAKASLVKAQADLDIANNVKAKDAGAISQEDLNKALGARDQAKGSLDKARASVEQATLNYNWCKVASPIDGRTNTHFVDIGNIVTADTTTLTNVVSLKPIWAYFDVDENTADKMEMLVKQGKVKAVRTNPLPVDMALSIDADDYPYKGKIDFVSNQIDPNTASIRVRAVFPNEEGVLVAGQFGRIRVPMGAEHEALLVNDRAIGTNQGNKFVLVLSADNKVEFRIVDVGQLHGKLRAVRRYRTVTETGPDGKGVEKKVEILKPTDRIVVDGLQRVRPGTVVQPTMVDMVTLMVEHGGKAAPVKDVPAKVEPPKDAPAKVEPKTEPAKTEPAKTEPIKTAPPTVEPPPPKNTPGIVAPPKLEPLPKQ